MKNKTLNRIVCLFFIVALLICGCQISNVETNSQGLNHYEISIKFDATTKTMQCEQVLNYTNKSNNALDEIAFHLYPNAFKEENGAQKTVSDFNKKRAYPNGFDSGYIDIQNVFVNGTGTNDFAFENDDTILLVKLGSAIYPDDSAKIKMCYSVKIPNMHHRFGYGEDTINVGNFYPIVCVYEDGKGFIKDGYHYNGDPFYSEMANYSVTISFNKDFSLASTGVCETLESENAILAKINAESVRDFAFVLSDKSKILYDVYSNIDIHYMYHKDKNPKQTMQTIKDALKTFNNLIGVYPYKTLSVVESNFIHGGMEYPNLVLISNEIENQNDYFYVVVHEIGHQWFYNIVGNNEYSEAWLDEGITEYITIMFFELNESYGITYDDTITNMLNSYLMYVDVYSEVFGELDTSIARDLDEFASEYDYTYMVYVKSVLMLDNLRDILGDSNFYLALKTYYENNKFKVAGREHFIRDFNKVSKNDLKGVIDSWLDGNVKIQNT